MAQSNHGFPVIVDAEDDEECNEVENNDMRVKKASRDVADGEHT